MVITGDLNVPLTVEPGAEMIALADAGEAFLADTLRRTADLALGRHESKLEGAGSAAVRGARYLRLAAARP